MNGCRQSVHQYLNPKQQNLRALFPFDTLCHIEGQTHESKLYAVLFQMDESWSIRADTANALENHATTYPVACYGHVRVLYILNNWSGVGNPDL